LKLLRSIFLFIVLLIIVISFISAKLQKRKLPVKKFFTFLISGFILFYLISLIVHFLL